MSEINFDISRKDADTIARIIQRAWPDMQKCYKDRISLGMDITAAHLNGNPLRLKELLAANDFDFFHDLYGIREHLDRDTGELKDCFVPRYSKPEGGA